MKNLHQHISLDAKIYVAGHRGMVGSALVRRLNALGYTNILTRSRDELDLTSQAAVNLFFETEKPEYVFLAAAKVGGILANNTYRGEFIYQNMMIQNNVIHAAYVHGVKRLMFLGSSCIYPKLAPQPLKEEYLLTGPLEPTNQPYAVAKISGIEMCWSYNRQYGTKYLAVMPTNLYGPGDNYHPENSHVIPALIRRIHEAKVKQVRCEESGVRGEEQQSVTPSPLTPLSSPDDVVVIWGTGTPRREFLYCEDMAEACVYLMMLSPDEYDFFLNDTTPPLINIGTGEDITIAELAETICKVVGYTGKMVFDPSKPDGTMEKLLDVSLISSRGWKATTGLEDGLRVAYRLFLEQPNRNPL
ncbi:MAG: GDP-fucose synthetase [Geobacteraceae bacterium GWC2_53_11]|nr:MAG: GDP-fucose synthetase [Geobacteraceae bacterium GWC2_53_11]